MLCFRRCIVCNGLASPADAAWGMCCNICVVIGYRTHRFDVDSNFRSYPAAWSRGTISPNSSKSVQYSCKAKKPMFSRDITSGHRDKPYCIRIVQLWSTMFQYSYNKLFYFDDDDADDADDDDEITTYL